MKGPKRIFSALSYDGMPDPRTLGLEPLYVAYDGTLNKATTPEGRNNYPAQDGSNAKGFNYAARRVARAAAGVEDDIPHHNYFYPSTNRVPQAVCFDLEAPEWIGQVQAKADPVVRKRTVDSACRLISTVRNEWQAYSYSAPLGIYLFPPAPVGVDPSEFAPLMGVVDCFFPEAYRRAEPFDTWAENVKGMFWHCRGQHPTKPIYVFISPWYQAGAPNREIPIAEWLGILGVLSLADGVVIWGGNDQADPTGVRRLKWPAGGPAWLAAMK